MNRLINSIFQRKFICPVCNYRGGFNDLETSTGKRMFATCPRCGSLERHRLQKLVLDSVVKKSQLSQMSVLHIAPENHLRTWFKNARRYVTADLMMQNVDVYIDLQEKSQFQDGEFDLVFASHVLEHIKNDLKALAEVRRILRPGGVAFLPVPIVGHETIEYPQPNIHESGHVRAPGYDYFNRYHQFFDRVELISSDAFPEKHQLYIYEDRTKYPTEESPMRMPSEGIRHPDSVPVCYA